jgi:hypothetical protein
VYLWNNFFIVWRKIAREEQGKKLKYKIIQKKKYKMVELYKVFKNSVSSSKESDFVNKIYYKLTCADLTDQRF